MKLTKEDILRIRLQLSKQRELARPKKKIGKKLFPVKYSSDYIKTGERPRILLGDQTVNIRGIGTFKRSDAIFDNHGRVGGRTARGGVPKGVGLSGNKRTPTEFRNPFLQQAEYIRHWASATGSKHGVDVWHHMRVSASWVLYFFASEYFWEFTAEDGQLKRSVIYTNKAQAYQAKDFNYVRWID